MKLYRVHAHSCGNMAHDEEGYATKPACAEWCGDQDRCIAALRVIDTEGKPIAINRSPAESASPPAEREREMFEKWAIDERKWPHSDIADIVSDGAPRQGEYRHCGLQDECEVWQARASINTAELTDEEIRQCGRRFFITHKNVNCIAGEGDIQSFARAVIAASTSKDGLARYCMTKTDDCKAPRCACPDAPHNNPPKE